MKITQRAMRKMVQEIVESHAFKVVAPEIVKVTGDDYYIPRVREELSSEQPNLDLAITLLVLKKLHGTPKTEA